MRIVAAAVVQRAPLVLPALSPFEREFYRYQRHIQHALSRKADLDFYYRKGTPAAEAARTMTIDHDLSAESEQELNQENNISSKLQKNKTEKDIDRLPSRTLYLLVRKNREKHAWQFPQGAVKDQESLADAAARELFEECARHLDVWPMGKVPAASYAYQDTRVFFHPFAALRGSADAQAGDGEVVDHAWLTRDEISARVDKEYYTAVSPLLSRL